MLVNWIRWVIFIKSFCFYFFLIMNVFRFLKIFSIEDSDVIDEVGEWLYELVCNNLVLEVINFVVFGFEDVDVVDLVLLVKRCKVFVFLKICEVEIVDMIDVFIRVFFFIVFGMGICDVFWDEDSMID